MACQVGDEEKYLSNYIIRKFEDIQHVKSLVGYNKHLYLINSDFQVAESYDNYMSCGCGEQLALGSLYTTENTELDPIKRINIAFEVAAKFSSFVLPPFNIMQL